MSGDIVKVEIVMPKKVYEILEVRAKQSGITVSDVVLRAIVREIEEV